jgi:CheY-like chemotaxis protein
MASGDEAMSGLTTAAGERPRVAIVGGTPSGIMVATVLIEQFGCSPLNAPTGEAVLSLLRADEEIDLVVIDLSVADMDGIVAVQLIRALGARGALPVVALTSDHADIAAPRARAAGFAGSVAKPYSPRELYAAMRSALGSAATATVTA